MTLSKIYFVVDKRNGKVYKPDGRIALNYSEDKILYAMFKDVSGEQVDIPYNQLRIIEMK